MGSLAVAPVVPGSQIPFDLDKGLLPLCNLVVIAEDGPAFTAHIRRDRERWARVVAQGNIRAE
jgi:hypothetical protein